MKLSEHQLEIIAKAAAIAAIEQHVKNQERLKKEKHDRRLHNIKLLLKHYRSMVLHCETIVDELVDIDSMSIQDLDVSTINLESIESIKKSRKKSLAMVMFIRSKIETYKKSCTDEELKYFRVLEKKYLTEKKYSIMDIAEEEQVDRATVYRYLDRAIAELPVVFFGVDAIQFK